MGLYHENSKSSDWLRIDIGSQIVAVSYLLGFIPVPNIVRELFRPSYVVIWPEDRMLIPARLSYGLDAEAGHND